MPSTQPKLHIYRRNCLQTAGSFGSLSAAANRASVQQPEKEDSMENFKRTLFSATCAVFGLLAASGAYAQFYVGAGVGKAKIDLPDVNTATVTGTAATTKDTAFKLFAGYQISPIWGAEYGYDNLGKKYNASFTAGGISGSAPFKLSNNYLAATGRLPIGSSFAFLGKLGAVRNSSNGGGGCAGPTCVQVGADKNRIQPMIGIGAEFSFAKNLAIRVEYETYGKTSDDDVWGTGSSGAVKAKAGFVSLKYGF
jgi:OOP family OmpA-OmpF porin